MGIEKFRRKISAGGEAFAVKTGTVSVNPDNASGGHETVAVALTITGAAVGDLFVFIPPASLEDDLIPKGARVTAANTVTLYLYAGATVNGAALTWTYFWFDFT